MPGLNLQQLTQAFDSEGFEVVDHAQVNGQLGITAKHRTALSGGDPQKRKKAFYVEGTHHDMGYLLGRLAEADIAEMTTHFVNNMIWELFLWHPRAQADPHSDDENKILKNIKLALGNLFAELIAQFNQPAAPGAAPAHLVPAEYLEELDGILEGCLAANPATKVNMDDLLVLNFGIDWFLGNGYSGLGIFDTVKRAILCNGFSLCKGAAGGGHFFGRDFMFPTASIFGERACHIIANPEGPAGSARLPFISLTAPGMIGSVTGMNRQGVAIGVEIVPSRAADVRKVGLNSLVLNRHVVETAVSAEAAVDAITAAPRTVPWLYIVADGTRDKACVVETVDRRDRIDFASFPPKKYVKKCLFNWHPLLPGQSFLAGHQTAPQDEGVMVRWGDYAYDTAYLAFDERLFQRLHGTLDPHALDEDGRFNKTLEDANCPGPYFFAPQRETRDDVVLTTNHYVIPEMRYTSMDPWLKMIFGKLMQDSQWRYDALNKRILDELAAAGSAGIDYATAKEILRFLSPDGQYPDYYGVDADIIEGAQSLCDLKNLTVESRYGHYADDWVLMSLKKYLP
jgi:hypothetical protein